MTKDEEAMAKLTRDILVSYYCDSGIDLLLEHLADDVVFLGADRYIQAVGRERVEKIFREHKDTLTPLDIWGEKYIARMLGDNCGFCEAFFDVQTKPESGMFLKGQQRSTFIYRRAQGDKQFEIVHLHNSVEYEGLEPGELMALARATKNAARLDARLSLQDYEIIHAIIHGQTNAQIAQTMNYSESNVKKRLSAIYRQLGLKNRTELARFFVSEEARALSGGGWSNWLHQRKDS